MTTASTDLARRLGIRHPIVQAPMAGGPDTPELAAAVSRAGGLGSLGLGYLSAEAIEARIAETRALTDAPFAVNLFAPFDRGSESFTGRSVLDVLRGELGLPPLGTLPRPEPPSFENQLEAVLRAGPRALSFSFGPLSRVHLRALRDRDIVTVGTATTPDEASELEELGVDAICAQGSEAGGHRGTFLGSFEDALVGTMALVPRVVSRVKTPVIAAGGIMNGQGIVAALALGASAAQLGTAFLDCDEAGTAKAHRAALHDPALCTVVTRTFSGRPARGIRNRFSDAMERHGSSPFWQHQAMTRELRSEATRQGRPDLMQMWAGQGAPLARSLPAERLVETLVREMLDVR